MNADVVSWTIALELSLPFIVLTIFLIILLMKGKKKSKTAVRGLILKIKNNEERQKENLKEYLMQKLMFDEKHSKAVSKKIINESKFLFRNLISSILDQNVEALAGLEDDLSRITDHYHHLEIDVNKEEPETEAGKEEKENIEELKHEIKTLKHEVHVTLTTLNNIFGEFSSMFGEEVPDTEMSVDQIITAMETFTTKSEGDESEGQAESAAISEPEVNDEPDAFSEDIEEIIVEDNPVEADPVEDVVEVVEQTEQDITEVNIDLEDDSTDIESVEEEKEELDFSIDSELDDIDSALDDLELGQSPSVESDEEPSWDDAFEESGDTMEDEK